ncbi:MAG: restriction endonuclease subunit S, partial [Ignavibacteriaceae bacterium]|nr:restriction endonuclease subunit S [Ignavibacteriaceae bacterium]
MSRISELIQELCPDGVEYIKLKTLIDKQIIINVKAPVKLKKENYKLSGKYPIIDQGQNYIVGFSDDDSSLVPKGLYVIFGDHTENFKFADFPFIQGADGIKILRTTRQFLDTRYFYYALESYYLKTGGYTRHYSFLMDTSIPIPPLEIQEEIVKILDNFTQLEAELEAELEARKKQYEYYRNKLLSFEGKDVEWK